MTTVKKDIVYFDSTTETWHIISGYIPENRNIKLIPYMNDVCFCSPNWNKIPSRDCSLITAISRIGSMSNEAEVYKISVNNIQLAAKIMPIIDLNSEKQNEKEIGMAIEASNIVKRGESPYFPIVYKHSVCDDTIFSDQSKYNKPSRLFTIKKYVSDQFNSKKLSRETHTFITEEEVRQFSKDNEIVIPPDFPKKIPSHILISELAWGDLKNLCNLNMDENGWDIIITQVFNGISDMHTKLNILHNDLHTGNILVLFIEKDQNITVTCLIHDFGKSKYRYKNSETTAWTLEDRKKDFIVILDDLSKCCKNQIILEKIKEIASYIDYLTDIDTVEESIINYWDGMVEKPKKEN